tara:strand:- start:123 stop:515 length:393 start_codon:yes stop_codon:yes gene_type:complete
MKATQALAYAMGAMFILGETARRGIDYFSINATTMLEDYGSGILLILAAAACTAKLAHSAIYLAGAWGYAAGGMFVPFFAHLEAYLRGATFRPDHPIEDVNGIIIKGVIWGICVSLFIASLRDSSGRSAH